MDPINIEKLQAMKSYNMSKNIFSTMVHYSLVVLTLGFFLSTPLWLPTLCSSMKLFLLDSLPIVCGPKCLFVVFNLIIIFLVGESRLTVSSSKLNIYEEYVTHTQRLKGGLSTGEEIGKESVAEGPLVEEEKEEEEMMREEKKEEVVESVEKEEEEEEEDEIKLDTEVLEEEVRREEEDLEEPEEEKGLLPAEELNQRVEAFIAMVNMQMRLEARMLTCCG